MSGGSAPEIPVYARLALEIVDGRGCHVTDREGREFLDLYGGHAVAALGHGHPGLVSAIQQQTAKLLFQTNAVNLEVRDRALRALVGFAPEGLDRAFLVSSGAEANENGLRAAIRFTGRTKVVSLRGGFHGRTAAAGACTDGSQRWYGFPRTPFDVVFVEPEDGDALEAAIDDDCAAVILEPVQGVAGARDLSHDFVRLAREVTQRHGALLLADEVQCGVGRCGTPFAIEAAGVAPDLLTTAKGLGGGFPVGALLVSEAISSSFGAGDLGTTFGGGPVACAAVECVIGELSRPGVLENVRRLGQRLHEECRVGPVESIQGRGLLVGLVCSISAKEVLPRLRERGILAGSASDPRVVRLMPPLVLEDADVDRLRDALLDIGNTLS